MDKEARASRIAHLVTSSAKCVKRRMQPLGACTLSNSNTSSKTSNKNVLQSNTEFESKDFDTTGIDDENFIKSLIASYGKSAAKNVARNPSKLETNMILGSSSAQPLRLMEQNRTKLGKNRVCRFVGDQQPDTDIQMADLFGVHPLPKLVMRDVFDVAKKKRKYANCDKDSLTDNELSTNQKNRKYFNGNNVVVFDESELCREVKSKARNISEDDNDGIVSGNEGKGAIEHDGVDKNNTNGQTETCEDASRHRRRRVTCYLQQQIDENENVACHDAELPSDELLEYIHNIANKKLNKAAVANSSDIANNDASSHNSNSSGRLALNGMFSSSALVAVAVLVEELIRDMMHSWYTKGSALGTLDLRSLRVAALAQLNNAPDPSAIPIGLLQNRLEAVFNQDLETFRTELELFKKVSVVQHLRKLQSSVDPPARQDHINKVDAQVEATILQF